MHKFDSTNGGWIDDGEILLNSWRPGMAVKAVNYCVDEQMNTYKSIQLIVGNDKEEFALRKHGGNGGKCR